MQYGDLYIAGSVIIAFIICMTILVMYTIQTIAPVKKTNASTRFWKEVLPSIKDIVISIFEKKEKE